MAKHGRNPQRLELSGFTLYLSRIQAFGGARYHTASDWHQASVTRTGASQYSASRTDGGPLIERPDRPGSVSLTPAGRERAGVMEGGSLSFIRLEFSDDFLIGACQLDGSRRGMIPIYNDRAEKFRVLIERMTELSEMRERPPVIIMEQLAIAAVRQLARDARLDFGRHDDAWMHPVALQRVIDRIEAEMHEDLSLTLFAQDAGLSISAFVRAFRGECTEATGDHRRGLLNYQNVFGEVVTQSRSIGPAVLQSLLPSSRARICTGMLLLPLLQSLPAGIRRRIPHLPWRVRRAMQAVSRTPVKRYRSPMPC